MTGFLVDSVEQCAERIVRLVQDGNLRAEMGRAGRARTRDRFLVLRELEDQVRMFASLAGSL